MTIFLAKRASSAAFIALDRAILAISIPDSAKISSESLSLKTFINVQKGCIEDKPSKTMGFFFRLIQPSRIPGDEKARWCKYNTDEISGIPDVFCARRKLNERSYASSCDIYIPSHSSKRRRL